MLDVTILHLFATSIAYIRVGLYIGIFIFVFQLPVSGCSQVDSVHLFNIIMNHFLPKHSVKNKFILSNLSPWL